MVPRGFFRGTSGSVGARFQAQVLSRRRVSVGAKPPLRRAPAIYLDARRTIVCALNEAATLRVSALPLAEK